MEILGNPNPLSTFFLPHPSSFTSFMPPRALDIDDRTKNILFPSANPLPTSSTHRVTERSQISPSARFRIFPRPAPLRYVRAKHNDSYKRKFEPYLNPFEAKKYLSDDILRNDIPQWDFRDLNPGNDTEEESLVLDTEDSIVASNAVPIFHEESEGYFTIPSKSAIEGLTNLEMSKMKSFTVGKIERGELVGQIEWKNVDIRSVDLREIKIDSKMVEVYSDDFTKPSIGSKLNCPALIRLWKVWPTKKGSLQEPSSKMMQLSNFELSLRKKANEFKAEFVSYDGISGEWVFRVPCF